MTTLILSPAYGRDYEDALALLADWHQGKDFFNGVQHIIPGAYCSRSDLRLYGRDYSITDVKFLFSKKRKSVVLTYREACGAGQVSVYRKLTEKGEG